MKIILGSASQGRKWVLEKAGFDFEVMPSDIDEKSIRAKNPSEMVLLIAQAKAKSLLTKIKEPAILITSDQVIMCNGKVREKPTSELEAREFLQSYTQYPAETVGAAVVANTKTGKMVSHGQNAKIFFKPIPESAIEEHIKSGAAMRGSGGFILQDPVLAPFIDHIEGSWESALGLDIELVKKMITEVTE